MTVGQYATLIGYFNSVGIQPSSPVHAMPQDPEGDRVVPRTVTRSEPHPPLAEPRFQPMVRADMNATQREVIDWASGGRSTGEGNIQVRFCLYHPELCRDYWGLTSQMLVRNITMPVRDHELVITRTAWLTHGHTIWSNHLNTPGFQAAGLNTPATIKAITEGPNASGWRDWDRTILRATDEWHTYRFIQDPTWEALAQRYNEGQLFEFLMLVGNYTNVITYFQTVGNPPGRQPPIPMPSETR